MRKRKKVEKSAYHQLLEREIDSLKRQLGELREKQPELDKRKFGEMTPTQTMRVLEEIQVPSIEAIQEEKKKKKATEEESAEGSSE